MNYPTMDEVNAADRRQICEWNRFLPSPGTRAIGRDGFESVMRDEAKIMDRIVERLKELGGFTPAISKQLGWG